MPVTRKKIWPFELENLVDTLVLSVLMRLTQTTCKSDVSWSKSCPEMRLFFPPKITVQTNELAINSLIQLITNIFTVVCLVVLVG